jgi:drug/metabolite transporter (DMT)-like permease
MSRSFRAFIDGKPFNIFLGLLAIVIWSYAYIVIRVTVKNNPPTIPPISLAFIRFVIGYVALQLIPVREEKKLRPRDNWTIVWMALTGLTVYFYFEHTGLIYTSATNASILVSLVPVIAAIGAAVFFKQKFSRLNMIGFPIAFIGGALIIWNGKVNFHLKPLGDFLILMSAVSWGLYTLVSKDI